MVDSFLSWFSHAQFMPHGHCYLWKPSILWTHVISDLLIAISYFSIPIMLYYFIYKKQDAPYKWLFRLFAIFIFWCGLTHLISIWTVWDPIYQIEGLAKGVTAAVSVLTAICLIPTLPKVLSLRSPEVLEQVNLELKSALLENREVEKKLKESNESLEEQVLLRTEKATRYSEQLRAANQELESFAHRASHDLKSPICTVLSMIDDIKQGSQVSTDKLKTHLPMIESNLNRLSHLINDLLEFSKLKELELDKDWYNLGEMVNDAKLGLQHLVDERGAKIYIDNNQDIYCNRVHMVSVFQNLIENAIRYTPNERNPEIIISAASDSAGWKISVTDNGMGVPKENIQEIFKPFHRLHHDDQVPGTGLGLSICKRVLEAHQGDIALEQNPTGPGSMVIMTLAPPS